MMYIKRLLAARRYSCDSSGGVLHSLGRRATQKVLCWRLAVCKESVKDLELEGSQGILAQVT